MSKQNFRHLSLEFLPNHFILNYKVESSYEKSSKKQKTIKVATANFFLKIICIGLVVIGISIGE